MLCYSTGSVIVSITIKSENTIMPKDKAYITCGTVLLKMYYLASMYDYVRVLLFQPLKPEDVVESVVSAISMTKRAVLVDHVVRPVFGLRKSS